MIRYTKFGFLNYPRNIVYKVEEFIIRPFISINDDNSDLIDTKILDQEKEINLLKEELSLRKTNTKIINATVTIRNPDSWYSYLVIDKGENSKVKENMAVITPNGLIGKVKSVMKDYSIVSLITDDSNNISVGVKGKDGYHHGLITGYKNNLIVISGLTNYDYIYPNSKAVTTGINNFPSGILIGYVEKIEDNSYDISKKIYIRSKQNFDDIRYVSIIGEE